MGSRSEDQTIRTLPTFDCGIIPCSTCQFLTKVLCCTNNIESFLAAHDNFEASYFAALDIIGGSYLAALDRFVESYLASLDN